ncbi:MAG: ATP-binding protein, partial [Candidatus Omnitrophota bacterium]
CWPNTGCRSGPRRDWCGTSCLLHASLGVCWVSFGYTPPGKNVCLRVVSSSQELRFEVLDSGPGIEAEKKNKVFDKFFRVFEEKAEGTGLGLSICKEIVDLHKGKIWVESEKGKGATFVVLLPIDLRGKRG